MPQKWSPSSAPFSKHDATLTSWTRRNGNGPSWDAKLATRCEALHAPVPLIRSTRIGYSRVQVDTCVSVCLRVYPCVSVSLCVSVCLSYSRSPRNSSPLLTILLGSHINYYLATPADKLAYKKNYEQFKISATIGHVLLSAVGLFLLQPANEYAAWEKDVACLTCVMSLCPRVETKSPRQLCALTECCRCTARLPIG